MKQIHRHLSDNQCGYSCHSHLCMAFLVFTDKFNWGICITWTLFSKNEWGEHSGQMLPKSLRHCSHLPKWTWVFGRVQLNILCNQANAKLQEQRQTECCHPKDSGASWPYTGGLDGRRTVKGADWVEADDLADYTEMSELHFLPHSAGWEEQKKQLVLERPFLLPQPTPFLSTGSFCRQPAAPSGLAEARQLVARPLSQVSEQTGA